MGGEGRREGREGGGEGGLEKYILVSSTEFIT